MAMCESNIYFAKTNLCRKKQRDAMQNGTDAPVPTKMAFGGGGHDADGEAVAANPAISTLNAEYLQKDFDKVYNEDDYSITYIAKLGPYELIGYTVSEIGIMDQDGDLMAVLNFSARVKSGGTTHTGRIRMNF